MKTIIKFFLKIILNLIVYIITYVGSLFFIFKKGIEPNTSWELAREEIFNLGIEYWENILENFSLKKVGIDVLEVGSGNGQWLIAFSNFANRVIGIEPSETILNYSKDKISEYKLEKKIELNQASAENLPYEDKIVDLVFCSSVFMFTKQDQALIEFNRVLKKEGKLLITVNGLGYFIMYFINGMKYRSVKKTRYGLVCIFNTFYKWLFGKQIGTCAVSYNEMKKLLEKNNFKLTDTRIWVAREIYPMEHLGFVTNYAFIAQKMDDI